MSSKLNVLLSGLLFLTSSQAFCLGEQEINFVHSVHQLGVSFDEVPAIAQNADALTAIFEMHVNGLETKVQESYSNVKSALFKNAALAAAVVLVRPALIEIGTKAAALTSSNFAAKYIIQAFGTVAMGMSSFTGALAAINLYDVFKEKNALVAELELNQEILSQLQGVQTMSTFMEQNNSQKKASQNEQKEVQEDAQQEDIQE